MPTAQQTAADLGYKLASTDAARVAANNAVFAKLAKAARRSNRPDAEKLAAHYESRMK